MRSKRHSFLTNFLKLTGSFGINLYSLDMQFHEKIFTTIIIIQLWNFGNFGISEIIPKSLVTLRFSKISLHELKISCKTFQMRHWPNFYFDPAYSNTWLTCNATRFKTNAHDCKYVSPLENLKIASFDKIEWHETIIVIQIFSKNEISL